MEWLTSEMEWVISWRQSFILISFNLLSLVAAQPFIKLRSGVGWANACNHIIQFHLHCTSLPLHSALLRSVCAARLPAFHLISLLKLNWLLAGASLVECNEWMRSEMHGIPNLGSKVMAAFTHAIHSFNNFLPAELQSNLNECEWGWNGATNL